MTDQNETIHPSKYFEIAENNPVIWGKIKGQRLTHKIFGEGTIVNVEFGTDAARDSYLLVKFDNQRLSEFSLGVLKEDIITKLSLSAELIKNVREAEKVKLQESIDAKRQDELEALAKKRALESEIKCCFSKYKISCLWYITHKDNVQGIMKHGILNHYDANATKDISNAEVQKRREEREPCYNRRIHSYVPLYINPLNPMLYVRQEQQNDLCLLEVSFFALAYNTFLITDGNAAAIKTKFYNSLNGLDVLDWDVLNAQYWGDFPDGKRKRCAEVLVYPKVDPKFIYRINCYSYQTLKFLSDCGCEVSLTKKIFSQG